MVVRDAYAQAAASRAIGLVMEAHLAALNRLATVVQLTQDLIEIVTAALEADGDDAEIDEARRDAAILLREYEAANCEVAETGSAYKVALEARPSALP